MFRLMLLRSLHLFPLLLVLLSHLPSLLARCSTDLDCSLSGICHPSTGLCTCDLGWRSADCSELDVRPATLHSGYNLTAQGTSSWGGKIVRDPTSPSLFHLFAAEFTGKCGLDYWSPMSRVIRATSSSGPAGPYAFAAEVVATFAHNPTVVYSARDRLYLLYHIGCPIAQPTACHSPSLSCDGGNAENGESGVTLWSSADLLHWAPHGMVFRANANKTWDQDTTNPSPFPLPTGEVVLAYRGCPYNCGGPELINVAVARNYSGPYERLNNQQPMFHNANEDPFVWRDRRGHWHMLLHSLEAGGAFGDGPRVGRHAYARSYEGPWTFNNVTLAYNTTTQFTDGSVIDYFRRERPQLFFSEDGLMTPLYLSNGVQQRNTPQSYTLIQPLGPAKAYEEQLGIGKAQVRARRRERETGK